MCDVKKEVTKMTHNQCYPHVLTGRMTEEKLRWAQYKGLMAVVPTSAATLHTNPAQDGDKLKLFSERTQLISFCHHTACSLVEMRWRQVLYSKRI
jgi:hypothetical protein